MALVHLADPYPRNLGIVVPASFSKIDVLILARFIPSGESYG